MFDMEMFPTADALKNNGEGVGNAIFEMELQSCFVCILDAVRQGKKSVRVGISCSIAIPSFLEEKGYKVERVELTTPEKCMRKYLHRECIDISWE